MGTYRRKESKATDILECESEELRRGFAKSARTIGKFQTESGDTTAHILHLKPLLVGAISQAEQGKFFPETPGYYNKNTSCISKGRHLESNYTVYQCEDMPGAIYNLEFAFPKIQGEENTVELAYENGNKVVDEGNRISGGVVMKMGKNQLFGVVGNDGKVIKVEELRDMYDQHVWPVAKFYSFETRRRYFTFFREYEANKGIKHSGTHGTRYRHLYTNIYMGLFKAKMWNNIKWLFGFEHS